MEKISIKTKISILKMATDIVGNAMQNTAKEQVVKF